VSVRGRVDLQDTQKYRNRVMQRVMVVDTCGVCGVQQGKGQVHTSQLYGGTRGASVAVEGGCVDGKPKKARRSFRRHYTMYVSQTLGSSILHLIGYLEDRHMH
jgi:hypothetical protein